MPSAPTRPPQSGPRAANGRAKPIRAVTRSQTTVAAIRSMVLSGELKPGERLRAQGLAEKLSVSRTPVNDALAALFKDGLLDYSVNKGYSVKAISLEQLLDAFDVRLTLEGLACKTAAERGLHPDVIASLDHNIGETERVLFGESWGPHQHQEWRRLNLQYHDLLLGAGGNAYLISCVVNARSLPPVFNQTFKEAYEELWPLLERRFSQQALADHVRILDAVARGQACRAENMMREHIFTTREMTRTIVERILASRRAEA